MDAEGHHHFAEGTRFGAWVTGRLLGEGTFGAVYEAVHEVSGARSALKVLHERLTRHPQALKRFFREAEAIASLQVLNDVTTRPILPPRVSRPDLPAGLDEVICRALEKDPNARFADMRTFGMALLPFASAATAQRVGPYLVAQERGPVDRSTATAPSLPIADHAARTLPDHGAGADTITFGGSSMMVATLPTTMDPVGVAARPTTASGRRRVIFGATDALALCAALGGLAWGLRREDTPAVAPRVEVTPAALLPSSAPAESPDPARVALDAVKHRQPAPPPAGDDYERALHCRDDVRDLHGENLCVIAALEGRADQWRARQLLAAAYRREGRNADAARVLAVDGLDDWHSNRFAQAAIFAVEPCLAMGRARVAVLAVIVFDGIGRPGSIRLTEPAPASPVGECLMRTMATVRVSDLAHRSIEFAHEFVRARQPRPTSPAGPQRIGGLRTVPRR